jgi:hypothetical protein
MNITNERKTTSKSKFTWGLGIEHEMRVRFEKGFYQFSKDFTSSFFPSMMIETLQNSSGYIFVNSKILLFYFFFMEVFLCKHYFQYAKTKEEKKYANEIVIMYDLYQKAKAKEMFPLDNPLYFERTNHIEKIERNIKFVYFYIQIYCLYHYPLCFFDFIYRQNTNDNIHFMTLWDYPYQIENIMDKQQFDQMMTDFTSFYQGDFYKSYQDKVGKLLEENIIYQADAEFGQMYHQMIFSDYHEDNMNSKRMQMNDVDSMIKRYSHILRTMIDTPLQIEIEDKVTWYQTLYELYYHSIPKGDFSYRTEAIEFITVHYKNRSFEEMHQEICNYEDTFFKVLNHLPIFKKYVDIFGPLTYHQIGSVSESIEIHDIVSFDYHVIDEDYTGSYHIWITPPYLPQTTPERFMEECATLANKFQLIEPLIAGHFTSPSIEAFGDDGKLARTSLRQFVGAYSNYGTADISFLMGAPTHQISKYFIHEKDLIDAIKEGKQNAIYAFIETPVYNQNGKPILNYEKLEERVLTSNLYKHFRAGNVNSKPPPIQDYYTLVFQKSKIRPIDNYLQLGPDIRTKNYYLMMSPLAEGWVKEYYKKEDKFIEVYVNYMTQQISSVPVYDKEKHKMFMKDERMGIELRVFDHFPTVHLQQILRVLSCLTYQSFAKPYEVTSKNMYIHQEFWHHEMSKVILQGFEYKPDSMYVKNIVKEFGLTPIKWSKYKNTLEKKTYTQILLEIIYRRLNKRYENIPLYKKLKFENASYTFESMNKKAWYQIFTEFLMKNPSVYRNLKDKKKIKKEEILKILGSKYKYNVERVKKFINVQMNRKRIEKNSI